MKSIIYQLLSKGLLLAVLLAVVAGYYYRVELFPKWFAEQETAQSTPAPVVDTQTPLAAAGEAETPAVTSGAEADPQAEAAADAEPVFRPLVEEEPATQVEAEPAVAEEPPQADLAAARRAYWARDLEGAIETYKAIIAAQPDNAAAHGELGNVYFAQGKAEEASESYLHAAEQLLAQGDEQGAARLMPVLVRLNPQYAAQLARALAEASNQVEKP